MATTHQTLSSEISTLQQATKEFMTDMKQLRLSQQSDNLTLQSFMTELRKDREEEMKNRENFQKTLTSTIGDNHRELNQKYDAQQAQIQQLQDQMELML